MKNEYEKFICQSEQALLDKLLAYKLDAQTVSNSEVAIKEICLAIDSLKNTETGYRLLGITSNKKSLLHLILKTPTKWSKFQIFTWEIEEKIEKGIQSTCFESSSEDLESWFEAYITELKSKNEESFDYDWEDLISYIIADTLKGYSISKKKFTDQCEFLASAGRKRELNITAQSEGSLLKDLISVSDLVFSKIDENRKDIRRIIADFAKNLDCEKLDLRVSHACINPDKGICIGKITRVIQNNNARTYQLKVLQFNKEATTVVEKTLVATAKAGVIGDKLSLSNLASIWIAETRPHNYYEDSHLENFNRIPYNHIDEGRYVVGIPRAGGTFDIIIGGDPRIDKDCKTTLCQTLERYVEALTKNLTKLSGTNIKDNKNTMRYEDYESSVTKESQDVKPLQIRLKALKKMVDEYQYIIKKQEAVGADIKISDKVVYNHKEGKVSYNDFSIAINDEMLKGRLFQTFEKYLVTYYRGETTEETILNDILDKIFEELKGRVNSFSSENTTIRIVLNDCINIDLKIKTSKNKAKLLYLNGQRFNKNEVLTVLREITCYRNQDEANRFISNIGKLGLSVYIGITTGYEAEIDGSKKLFRFKKLKGRSNYTLLLDTIEIGLKGKDLVNTLFAKFIGDNVPDFQRKIPKLIFESVESSADYVKYKFLIDTAYEAFKTRSEEFLCKKVSDVGGEFCKYFNASGKRLMNAVSLVGMSGRKYVIAYDAKNSYVFLDPQPKQGEKNTYEEGKYVCMIDQSNIKSNIGYDTVISKLLALKNDSVIARNIYNLEEEISEPGTEEGREQDQDRENDPE